MRPDRPNARQQAGAISEALQQARFALEMNRPAEAAQVAQAVLAGNAGNRDAAKVLGYALVMLGRAPEALPVLETAARGSHDAELETQFAVALRHCGRKEDAVTWLRRAVKRNPPFPGAFYELGLLLASLQRNDEAIDALKRGVAAAPLMADMVAQLGNLYYTLNDRRKASDCFRRALALNPGHTASLEALGTVLMLDHEFAQAAEIFRRMVVGNPDHAHARINLGNCLLGLGDHEGARACFRAASARGPIYFGRSLRVLVASSRGRFWLRPSAATKALLGAKG